MTIIRFWIWGTTMGILQLRTEDVTNAKKVMRYLMDAVDDMTIQRPPDSTID